MADDHKVIVDGINMVLENENDIEVVGYALNGDEVIGLLEENEVDIAILDIEMPGKSGVELTRIIKKRFPTVKVLVLSMYDTKEFVEEIITQGAKGYILKNNGCDEVVKAIRAIHSGRNYIGKDVIDILVESLQDRTRPRPRRDLPQLTKREKDVLREMVNGLKSKEISEILGVAPATIDTHRRNIIEKVGVSGTNQLLIYAMENKEVYK